MDLAYVSALAALSGSAIGGLTSLTASWLNLHVQFRAKQRASDLNRREELYRNFIEESSRLYADAFEHDHVEVSKLVNVYALISRMRVLSSPKIIEEADNVVAAIVETYLAPNRTLRDVREIIQNDKMNPLREFSNACREELRGRGSI